MSLTVRHGAAEVQIEVVNLWRAGRGITQTEVDGVVAAHGGGPFRVQLRDGQMKVRLMLGAAA